MGKQLRWKQPEYSKNKINKAGDIIRKNDVEDEDYSEAVKIVDNWRASHAYPLHVFYIHMRRMAENKKGIIVAERLKRLDSIIGKLSREEGMQLTRMQDLGGCRVILKNLNDVYRFRDILSESRMRHELVREYDYIKNPKKSGYRSFHMVYKFHSDTPGKEIFNSNMLIELQLRTHLQHVWATALETMGVYTNKDLKAGEGDSSVKRFFAIVSSLFALEENCPVVENTSSERTVLVNELKEICKNTKILDQLTAISVVILNEKKIKNKIKNKDGYYILMLNYEKKTLSLKKYMVSKIEEAREEYNIIESQKNIKNIDAVLVRAGSIADVRKAYPNYFMDMSEFVKRIKKYIDET